MQYFLIAAAIAAAIALNGCAWRGDISQNFYPIMAAEYRQELSVGIIDRYPPKPISYGMSVNYKLDLSNYKYAVARELENHFTNVLILDSPAQKPCDLYVVPKLNLEILQQMNICRGTLGLEFYTPDNKLLTRIETAVLSNAAPSSTLYNKTVLNQAMLGMMSSSIIEDYGKLITNVSEIAITELLQQAGLKMHNDPFLTTFDKSTAVPVDQDSHLKVDSAYAKYLNATVTVITPEGFGSGFFIDNQGKLLTNQHVVKSWPRSVIVMSDGTKVRAEVLKTDARRDLALLKIESGKPQTFLTLGQERDFKVGAEVIAIGSPRGLDKSVTRGIISQSRSLAHGVKYVQTDAAINSGNSGGPLIDKASGAVVGVNTLSYKYSEGLNFAVSVDEVRAFLGM